MKNSSFCGRAPRSLELLSRSFRGWGHNRGAVSRRSHLAKHGHLARCARLFHAGETGFGCLLMENLPLVRVLPRIGFLEQAPDDLRPVLLPCAHGARIRAPLSCLTFFVTQVGGTRLCRRTAPRRRSAPASALACTHTGRAARATGAGKASGPEELWLLRAQRLSSAVPAPPAASWSPSECCPIEARRAGVRSKPSLRWRCRWAPPARAEAEQDRQEAT